MTAAPFSVLRTVIAALACTLLATGAALAGPPLVTDDAGTVEVGKLELELNGSYSYDTEKTGARVTRCSTADAEMKITTGLHRDLGISLAMPYIISGRVREDDRLVSTSDGFGDMTVEVKYAFAELAGINLAVKPVIIIPAGRYSAGLSEGRWQFGGTLIATREFADGAYALHANLGYEHHDYRAQATRDSTRSDLWSGSVAGEALLLKGLTAVADFGLATTADRSTDQLTAYALTGARYEINNLLAANAGVKFGLSRPETDLTALYGLVLRY